MTGKANLMLTIYGQGHHHIIHLFLVLICFPQSWMCCSCCKKKKDKRHFYFHYLCNAVCLEHADCLNVFEILNAPDDLDFENRGNIYRPRWKRLRKVAQNIYLFFFYTKFGLLVFMTILKYPRFFSFQIDDPIRFLYSPLKTPLI